VVAHEQTSVLWRRSFTLSSRGRDDVMSAGPYVLDGRHSPQHAFEDHVGFGPHSSRPGMRTYQASSYAVEHVSPPLIDQREFVTHPTKYQQVVCIAGLLNTAQYILPALCCVLAVRLRLAVQHVLRSVDTPKVQPVLAVQERATGYQQGVVMARHVQQTVQAVPMQVAL